MNVAEAIETRECSRSCSTEVLAAAVTVLENSRGAAEVLTAVVTLLENSQATTCTTRAWKRARAT